MNNRLQQFLSAENISQAQLADTLKVARAGISHILAGRNKPSYDFIYNLMLHYPRLNLEWLMFGKGKLYRDMENKGAAKLSYAPELLFSEEEQLDDSAETIEESSIETGITSESIPVDNKTQITTVQRNIKKVLILFDDGSFQEF